MPAPHDPPVGVGHGPSTRLDPEAVQAVLDGAALLQARRTAAASEVARGEVPGVEIVARGMVDVQDWLRAAISGTDEVLSVRPAATTTQLRASLPQNRAYLASGGRMVSAFDYYGLDTDARLLLANEPVGDYLFVRAPVQMKILDRSTVLLDGPPLDGSVSLMAVRAGPCLEAAWRYWDAVVASAVPIEDVGASHLGDLTRRQRQIVALLASDLDDAAVAASLGVSVRTVRTDVARILDTLGVKSRFAAGVRIQMWGEQP